MVNPEQRRRQPVVFWHGFAVSVRFRDGLSTNVPATNRSSRLTRQQAPDICTVTCRPSDRPESSPYSVSTALACARPSFTGETGTCRYAEAITTASRVRVGFTGEALERYAGAAVGGFKNFTGETGTYAAATCRASRVCVGFTGETLKPRADAAGTGIFLAIDTSSCANATLAPSRSFTGETPSGPSKYRRLCSEDSFTGETHLIAEPGSLTGETIGASTSHYCGPVSTQGLGAQVDAALSASPMGRLAIARFTGETRLLAAPSSFTSETGCASASHYCEPISMQGLRAQIDGAGSPLPMGRLTIAGCTGETRLPTAPGSFTGETGCATASQDCGSISTQAFGRQNDAAAVTPSPMGRLGIAGFTGETRVPTAPGSFTGESGCSTAPQVCQSSSALIASPMDRPTVAGFTGKTFSDAVLASPSGCAALTRFTGETGEQLAFRHRIPPRVRGTGVSPVKLTTNGCRHSGFQKAKTPKLAWAFSH